MRRRRLGGFTCLARGVPAAGPHPKFQRSAGSLTSSMGSLLDVLRERVVVFDGATGTNLQACDLGPEDFGGANLEGCNEILVVTRPQVVAELHRSFFDVGVDAVETNTFGAFPVVLAEY